MKQINFLPLAVREKERQRRQFPFYVITALAAAGIVGIFWLVWHEQGVSVAAQLTQAQLQDQQRSQQLAKQQAADATQVGVVQRVALLNALSAQEIDWTAVFTKIGLFVDKDVRLTTLSAAASGADVGVKINGKAPSNLVFADFVQSLNASAGIAGLKVDTYAFNPTDSTVSFAMSYSLPASAIAYTKVKK